MQSRTAASLVELLIVLSMSTVLIGAGIGMIHTILETENSVMQSFQLQRSLIRLSQSFRRDVGASVDVTLIQEDDTSTTELRLELPDDERVVYRLLAETVKWEALVNGQIRGQDEFVLSAGSHVECNFSPLANRVTFSVFLANPHPDLFAESPPGRRMNIKATVGRDHRWNRGLKR